MQPAPIFHPYDFGEKEMDELNRDGHFLLPGLLTADTCERLTESLTHIESKSGTVIRSGGTASIAWVHSLSAKMVFTELSQAGFEGVPGTRISS